MINNLIFLFNLNLFKINNNNNNKQFFDGFSVEHTHVIVHSQKLGSPMPYEVLLTCLK